MKKFYLLLIALVCAVCANAEEKTAVFDFAGNPWGHTIGSGSGESAAAGNVDQLTADDGETIIEFVQGDASTPARFWNTSGANHVRCYGKSSVTITAPGVITNIKVTATTSGYLYVPSVFVPTEGDTKSKEVELDGTEDTYTINIQGTAHARWTRLEVSYEVEDGPAGEPTLSETNVTDLSTLGNKKAYALKAISGEGFFCYNPDVHATNVAICGVTDYSYQKSVGNAAWEAPFEVANANHQWQILTLDGKHYIYNLGAKKYLALNGGTYVFSETPAEMEIRTNSESESVDGHSELTLGGTFSIRAKGSGNLAYTCICTSRNNNPVATWSYNDHGGPMVITEIENVTDGTAIEALEELVAQQERTAEWNELLAAAKAEYNGNNKFSEGENIIKESSYFSSPYSCPTSKEPKSDITKLIDDDCKTYWHTDWTNEVAVHTHYLQVTLPEAIEGLTQLTMGRRDNNGSFCGNDNPVEMSVTFSADEENWSDPTYFDTPLGTYPANLYVKATFEVPAGTKYLRFYNEKSNGNLQRGYWHCGEFQLNPVVLDPTCVNAQYPTESYLFTETLAEADAVDAATVTAEQIAALKEAQAAYHFATYTYNAAELNTLAADVQAKVGEVEVVYVNGQYNYIKDESGITLLFDQNKTLTLTAGDKVQGLIVVGSPYNGLPEVKPLTAMDDLTVTPNAEYTFAPAEATAAPTAAGANQIWKYTGVKATADHTFATSKATNLVGTWQENDLTFRNAFKHLTTEFKEGKFYSIVGATAVYNNDVQVYVISAEEEASKVEVTYNVTFNGETLKSQTIGETVGQAPTFQVGAPTYVSVSGMPETIEEGVTEVTVETALNEEAPFDMENEYILNFTYTNAQATTYLYWFNDNESGKLNELRAKEDGVTIESLDESSRWTMGGDWLNGFTLQNVKTGNYVAAGDNYTNGTNVKVGETAEKYELVKYSAGWRLKVNNTFLAHYSANNHIVSYHNPENYAASYVTFTKYVAPAPIEPVETKTVTITFVTPSGDKYLLNNNEGTQGTIAYVTPAPASAQFEATLWTNGKYTFTNAGQYVGFRRMDSEFNAACNYWEVLPLEGVESSNITETVPEGSVYLRAERRSTTDSQVGVMIVANTDGSFANTTAPFFNGTYTSAILIEEYVAPAPENPFTVEYDGNETITITPQDPEATYFWGIANDAIMGIQSYSDVYEFFEGYLLPYFWEQDMCTGEITMTDTEYRGIWSYGMTEGLNYILVANGYWDPEANEGEGGAVRTGDIYVFEITTGVPTGVGTVLRQEADSKAIYNLQGQRLGKIQKGINIVNGKKILK